MDIKNEIKLAAEQLGMTTTPLIVSVLGKS